MIMSRRHYYSVMRPMIHSRSHRRRNHTLASRRWNSERLSVVTLSILLTAPLASLSLHPLTTQFSLLTLFRFNLLRKRLLIRCQELPDLGIKVCLLHRSFTFQQCKVRCQGSDQSRVDDGGCNRVVKRLSSSG